MSITAYIVVDNRPYRSDLAYEWGLSLYIEASNNILFDTGASGEVLLNNLEKLEINPDKIDAIVISHTHMDHVGGLKSIDQLVKKGTPLYYPRKGVGFFEPQNVRVIYNRESIEILPNIWLSEFPSILAIERGLVIDTGENKYLFLGCSHGGVLTHIEKAMEIFGDIYGVIGGFHISTKYEGINTAEGLNNLGIKYIATLHCTEDKAVEGLKEKFDGTIERGGTGKILELK